MLVNSDIFNHYTASKLHGLQTIPQNPTNPSSDYIESETNLFFSWLICQVMLISFGQASTQLKIV